MWPGTSISTPPLPTKYSNLVTSKMFSRLTWLIELDRRPSSATAVVAWPLASMLKVQSRWTVSGPSPWLTTRCPLGSQLPCSGWSTSRGRRIWRSGSPCVEYSMTNEHWTNVTSTLWLTVTDTPHGLSFIGHQDVLCPSTVTLNNYTHTCIHGIIIFNW